MYGGSKIEVINKKGIEFEHNCLKTMSYKSYIINQNLTTSFDPEETGS